MNYGLQGYGVVIALTIAAYYLKNYILSTHKDSKDATSKNQRSKCLNATQTSLFATETESRFPKSAEQHAEQIVYSCLDELNACLEEMKRMKCNRLDLIRSLKTIIAKYPSLKSSDYKESLNNMLVVQCENMCSVHLSADDMVLVWL